MKTNTLQLFKLLLILIAISTLSACSEQPSYQTILDTYSAKIVATTPELIKEYEKEASKNTDGIQGLAKISNDKISKLAMISNEEVAEMAKIMYTTGSGKYSEYNGWAEKLMKLYMSEAGKITDVYMKSAM